MRIPGNERALADTGRQAGLVPAPKEHTERDAVRRCTLSGDRAPRGALVRLALGPDGSVLPDVRAKAPGRGAWIGVNRATLEQAIAKGRLKAALARALKTASFDVPADLPQRIGEALERAVLDRLGLEARGGTIVIGTERIEAAARGGKLYLLLHAADAGADGNRKLDQAWRVGSDEEGSGRRGLVLPLARPILSVALGRENVVHVGVTDAGAARRLSEALGRWLHFIGLDEDDAPCETASRGASALENGKGAVTGPGAGEKID